MGNYSTHDWKFATSINDGKLQTEYSKEDLKNAFKWKIVEGEQGRRIKKDTKHTRINGNRGIL